MPPPSDYAGGPFVLLSPSSLPLFAEHVGQGPQLASLALGSGSARVPSLWHQSSGTFSHLNISNMDPHLAVGGIQVGLCTPLFSFGHQSGDR